jgi:hypothetical protein
MVRFIGAAKKRELGLGAYPEFLLGTARDKAREAKAKIEAGALTP